MNPHKQSRKLMLQHWKSCVTWDFLKTEQRKPFCSIGICICVNFIMYWFIPYNLLILNDLMCFLHNRFYIAKNCNMHKFLFAITCRYFFICNIWLVQKKGYLLTPSLQILTHVIKKPKRIYSKMLYDQLNRWREPWSV